MSDDINAMVLAAFQAEHKEQLEGIRLVLTELETCKTLHRAERIDEAFRLAHSLKGGARVCDLRPAEMLAHSLENVFEQVKLGSLYLDHDVFKTINVLVDAIEDWMAALDRAEIPADSREALIAANRLINVDIQDPDSPSPNADDVARRLIDTFLKECPQYQMGLRQFVAVLESEDREVSSDEVEEAYRLAHDLRGSANAADISSIEKEGKLLESLLGDAVEQSTIPDAVACAQLKQYLDKIERAIGLFAAGNDFTISRAVRTRDIDTTIDEAADSVEPLPFEPGSSSSKLRSTETVRISTKSLDKLLHSSRQLVGESGCQERMSRELEELRQQVAQMEREHESIRRVAASSLQRMTNIPGFNQLGNYFETVNRGVGLLARRTRRLCAVQKRNSWQLQSRGRQIQQDVREARMVPAEAVFQGLRKLVRDLARELGKQVEFRVSGFDVRADRMVFQTLKDPLIHMLRNCVVHGIEAPGRRTELGKDVTCTINLSIQTIGNRLTIEVEDDGSGIDRDLVSRRAISRGLISETDLAQYSIEQIENVIFQPGFSTSDHVTELAGRGMGLSVVQDAVTRLQGEVQVCRKPTAGTKFRIIVPLSVSTHRLLLVSAEDATYAIPVHGVERLLSVKVSDLESIEGKHAVLFQGCHVPLVSLTSTLGLQQNGVKINGNSLKIAILKSGARRVALSVDAFLAEKDLLIQELDAFAVTKAYLGAILLEDDNVALVLNPMELMERARPTAGQIIVEKTALPAEKRMPRVLVVDDSFTTRTLEKSILEANGYRVGIAVDGVEGLNRLKSEHYDLVISDVEMPRMDGFTLLAEIKKDHRLASIPVIMVTSKSRAEDREKGLDLGAEAYIVKQKFDHQSLLNTIRQIVDSEL